jgi:hypothetical protein
VPGPRDIRLDDILTLKKPHPCGGFQWEVVRVGMDIGIRCQTCGRRVLLVRRELERRIRGQVRAGQPFSGA